MPFSHQTEKICPSPKSHIPPLDEARKIISLESYTKLTLNVLIILCVEDDSFFLSLVYRSNYIGSIPCPVTYYEDYVGKGDYFSFPKIIAIKMSCGFHPI